MPLNRAAALGNPARVLAHCVSMPWANNPEIDTLRLKLKAAADAHQSCAAAIRDAGFAGVPASPAMINAEVDARSLVEEARAKLLAAITRAINGVDPADPPA